MFIHIKFNRNYRAAADGKKYHAEWPPAPYRFACALVNAFGNRKRATDIEDGRDELAQFMCQPPPIVITSAHSLHGNSVWVPSNAPNQKSDRKWVNLYLQGSNRALRHYPFVATEEAYYYWPGAEGVRHLFPWVSHIGMASSLVRVSEAAPPDGEFVVWEPDEGGRHSLRCPYAGMLDDLDRVYDTGNGDIRPLEYRYQSRRARIAGGVIPPKPVQTRFFETQYLMGVEAPFALSITQTARLAECFRGAIGSLAKRLSLKGLEGEIFSHEPKTHLSYAPLPHVLGKTPSGDIKGVMVCLPKELVEFRGDLETCLYGLKEVPFWCNDIRFGEVTVLPPRGLLTLRQDSWCRPSHVWASATPIGCHFSKHGDPTENEDWIRKDCAYYGLPSPNNVKVLRWSEWGHDAHDLRSAQRRTSTTNSFLTHAIIDFPIPVQGPVLLGRGRNFGLGLMYPL